MAKAKRAAEAVTNRQPNGTFGPGNMANPGGRPKRNLTLILANTVDPQELADKLYALALTGDMQAIKYIYDRIEGTPTQRIEFSDEEFMRRLREERPDLDDEKIVYITERARRYAEGAQ